MRAHRKSLVFALIIAALSSQIVLAKKHHNSHQSSSTVYGGSLVILPPVNWEYTPIPAGTLLVAPDVNLVTSGYQGVILNTGTLTTGNSYLNNLNNSVVLGATLTTSNVGISASSGAVVSNTGILNSSLITSGTLNIELANAATFSGSGTLSLAPIKESAGSAVLTLSNEFIPSSNAVIPSSGVVAGDGTLSVTTPEPTSLSLVGFAALAFLRRP